MILISHRGNLSGKIEDRENSPEYIQEAIDAGFNVEIDVRYIDKKWFLGHDFPQYEIDLLFLINSKLWCHAKNLEAFQEMLKNNMIHCFWHQEDDYTLTSRNYIWCYPNRIVPSHNAIVHLGENHFGSYERAAGVCSDFISQYQ